MQRTRMRSCSCKEHDGNVPTVASTSIMRAGASSHLGSHSPEGRLPVTPKLSEPLRRVLLKRQRPVHARQQPSSLVTSPACEVDGFSQAAVDGDGLAGDEGRQLGAEEPHRVRNVSRRPICPQTISCAVRGQHCCWTSLLLQWAQPNPNGQTHDQTRHQTT